VANCAVWFAIFTPMIPACDARCHAVPRGWFAIWFATRDIKRAKSLGATLGHHFSHVDHTSRSTPDFAVYFGALDAAEIVRSVLEQRGLRHALRA
jgi:hypothetical protein